jgi:hypothetical protein
MTKPRRETKGRPAVNEPLGQRLIVLVVGLALLATGTGLAVNASANVRSEHSTPVVIESDRPLETSATPAATTVAPVETVPDVIVAPTKKQAAQPAPQPRPSTVKESAKPKPQQKSTSRKQSDSDQQGADKKRDSDKKKDSDSDKKDSDKDDHDEDDHETVVPPIRDEDHHHDNDHDHHRD